MEKSKFLNCSCEESNYDGISCRHELALCTLVLKDSNLLYLSKRWEKDYFHWKEPEDTSVEGQGNDVRV